MHKLDVTGLRSPSPILAVRRALVGLDLGQHLVVIGDDPAMIADIPAFCTNGGHSLIMAEHSNGSLRFELARGEIATPSAEIVPLRRAS